MTINMLTGLARPDTGAIAISGIDCTKNPRTAQHLIGVVSDQSNLGWFILREKQVDTFFWG